MIFKKEEEHKQPFNLCSGIDITRKRFFKTKDDDIPKVIKLKNGSIITPSETNAETIRGARSNYMTFKDKNGDVVEMDMRDGSYRILCKAEELEEIK